MELRQIHLREEVRDNDSSWPDGRREAPSITATNSFPPSVVLCALHPAKELLHR